MNLLRSGQPIALVRYGEMGRNEAKTFVQLLKQKFPNAKVVLAVLGYTQEFQQPWNEPDIYNLYIDEKDFENWNGPAWAKAIHTIATMNPQGWDNV